ncbi:hypothetical protein AAFF_G00103250 [Aldrovandia affinis]|uniref:Uncharacterized protein n=1 Tax=Aldrovandia affinis TaxID=143900 RepID=A0AAD7RUR5_9TELE|nr:hypothetical protein AAFF_G00103250 [Aldrovandia affinis]
MLFTAPFESVSSIATWPSPMVQRQGASGLCFYHAQFGAGAKKCCPPCSFDGPGDLPASPTNVRTGSWGPPLEAANGSVIQTSQTASGVMLPRVAVQLGFRHGESGSSPQPCKTRALQGLSRAMVDVVHLGIDYTHISTDQASDPNVWVYRTATTSLQLADVSFDGANASLLCDISTGQLRPVVPGSWRQRVFNTIHSLSHPGRKPL